MIAPGFLGFRPDDSTIPGFIQHSFTKGILMKIFGRVGKTVLFGLTTCFALALAQANTNKKNSSNIFTWKNFESDLAGVARHVDPNLVNPWGMALSSSGTIWVADNGTGVATAYNNVDGNPAPSATSPLVVTIPASASNTEGANPTGIVSNPTAFFNVTKDAISAPSIFIFVSEDGVISGWNPQLDGTNAIVAVDNGADEAIYKGVTLGVASGNNFLYVTNFHSGHVEIYDQNFMRVDTATSFADANIPAGYAPFGIRNFGGRIYVTYALQDADQEDDVPGPGNGFINVFDTSGNLIQRLVSNGALNAPWGLAIVQGAFGKFQSALLVGNFGDGQINAYDPITGAFVGTPKQLDRTPLAFDGLWDLLFFNNNLFFTAGIADEEHGLFGAVRVATKHD